jgi:3-oxoacyl-[acyl-carrier protein] reductase
MSQKKVALITGGSRGIGRAITRELGRQGYAVGINYQAREADALELRDTLIREGIVAEAFAADVSDYAQVQAMCQQVAKTLGPIEVLVNNAGVTRDGLLMMMPQKNWQRVLEVNLNGVFNCSKVVARQMCARKRGVIINIGSGSGLSPRAGQTNYSATKSALIGFTRSLARETASYGVRALVVAPGFTRTELAEMVDSAAVTESLRMIPLGRWGLPEEIASVIGYMISDDAAYITGVTIVVDGGRAASEQDFGPLTETVGTL